MRLLRSAADGTGQTVREGLPPYGCGEVPTWRAMSSLPSPRSRSVPIVALGLVGLLGLAAACGEVGEPYLGAEVTVASTVVGAEIQQSGPVTDTVVDGAASESVLPPRDPGYVPSLVIGSDTGIASGSIDRLALLEPPLGELGATRIADDLFGGLVVQVPDQGVLWFPAEGAEAATIRETGFRLLDVGYLGGTSEALVLGESRVVERVRLVDLEVAEPIVELAESDQLVDFSAAGGLYVLAIADDQCGRIDFVNSAGDPVSIRGPVPAECPVPRRATYTLLDLSPDGDALAYAEVTYRSDGVEATTQLVGIELSSSTELFRIDVGGAGDRISSLTFDGRRVAFVRTPLEGLEREVVQIDALVDGETLEVSVTSPDDGPLTLTYARLPLTVGAASAG